MGIQTISIYKKNFATVYDYRLHGELNRIDIVDKKRGEIAFENGGREPQVRMDFHNRVQDAASALKVANEINTFPVPITNIREQQESFGCRKKKLEKEYVTISLHGSDFRFPPIIDFFEFPEHLDLLEFLFDLHPKSIVMGRYSFVHRVKGR